MNEIGEIGGCQNNGKSESLSNVKYGYYENNGYWNSETGECLNNGMNDSVNYVSSVFQNNEKNESLNLLSNQPIPNNGLGLTFHNRLHQDCQASNSIIFRTSGMVLISDCRNSALQFVCPQSFCSY